MCHGGWLTRSKQAVLQFLTLVCPFLCSLYKPGGGGGGTISLPHKRSPKSFKAHLRSVSRSSTPTPLGSLLGLDGRDPQGQEARGWHLYLDLLLTRRFKLKRSPLEPPLSHLHLSPTLPAHELLLNSLASTRRAVLSHSPTSTHA